MHIILFSKVVIVFNSLITEALSYRNRSIDLQSKSKDWFLYDNGLRHERVKGDENHHH